MNMFKCIVNLWCGDAGQGCDGVGVGGFRHEVDCCSAPITQSRSRWHGAVVAAMISAMPAMSAPLPPRGFDAPAIHLKNLDGAQVDAHASKDTTLVVIFGELGQENTKKACSDVIAALEDTSVERSKVETVMIVAQDGTVEQLNEKVAAGHYPATIARDEKREYFGAFRVLVVPTIVVIDTNGKVVHATPGFVQRFKEIVTGAVLVSQGKSTFEKLDQLVAAKGDDKLNPDEARAGRLVRLGRELMHHGMHDTAQERFSEAMKLAPENLDAMQGLGDVLIRKGKYAEAIAVFRSALAKSPDSAELTLGLVQAKLGVATESEVNDAALLIKQVLDTNPKNSKGHYLRGRLHEVHGRQADAIVEYRTAAELLLETQAKQ